MKAILQTLLGLVLLLGAMVLFLAGIWLFVTYVVPILPDVSSVLGYWFLGIVVVAVTLGHAYQLGKDVWK